MPDKVRVRRGDYQKQLVLMRYNCLRIGKLHMLAIVSIACIGKECTLIFNHVCPSEKRAILAEVQTRSILHYQCSKNKYRFRKFNLLAANTQTITCRNYLKNVGGQNYKLIRRWQIQKNGIKVPHQ